MALFGRKKSIKDLFSETRDAYTTNQEKKKRKEDTERAKRFERIFKRMRKRMKDSGYYRLSLEELEFINGGYLPRFPMIVGPDNDGTRRKQKDEEMTYTGDLARFLQEAKAAGLKVTHDWRWQENNTHAFVVKGFDVTFQKTAK